MPHVAIYRTSLLPASETFIKEQALAINAWAKTLIGYQLTPDGLDLTGLNVCLLPGMTAGLARAWHTKFCQWRGTPHPPTVHALRTLGVDLVHAHFGTDAADIWPSVKAASLPMLVTLHGYDINTYREWWEAGNGGQRRRNYPRRLLAMSQDKNVRFIAVSNAIRTRAIEYGIPEDKISIVHVGVDTERFRPGGPPIEQRARRILFVGRMVEKKAPLLMIRAFAEALKIVPDAELVMIGDGPMLSKAKELASSIGVHIRLMGRCGTEDVLKQLQDARVFCLPSVIARNGDAEGLPIVILEALACGLPVVTSANGAVGEAVIDGVNGFTFEPNDLSAMQAGITALLMDDRKWRIQSEQARKISASSHSIIRSIDQLIEVYDSMTSHRGSKDQ